MDNEIDTYLDNITRMIEVENVVVKQWAEKDKL